MKFVVVGAGAMGGSYGGHLARAGHEVQLVDTWREHVDAVNRDGLQLKGMLGEHTISVAAATEPRVTAWADVVIVFVDSNSTRAAAETAASVCAPDGCVITFQNGIGNVETLVEVVGAERVIGGSSMCSAAIATPGQPDLTHLGPTSIGELTGGAASARVDALANALTDAGFEIKPEPDIQAKIWNKCVVNAGINAICATTGLRLGEMIRIPELDEFQTNVLKEVLAVIAAKNITLPDPDVVQTIKSHCWRKFSRPSMQQHVDAGRITEIDAINGAIVREARALGIPTPYNESLTALLKGRERREQQRLHEAIPDYDALEAAAEADASFGPA